MTVKTVALTPQPKSSKVAFVIIIAAVFLLALFAVFYFFILPTPQSSLSLLSELPRTYLLYDGLTINMDGSPDETFWLREGFGPSITLASAPDGKGRPVGASFSLAFERWQARSITLDVGVDAQPMCRQLGLKVNGRDAGIANLTPGYQTLSIPIPDETLTSGGNIAAFTLTGEGECAATVDYIRIRLGGSGTGNAPSVDQRLVGGVKTDVLGTSSPCEANFYVRAPKNAHLAFTLGHDKEQSGDSPGRLRIWRQGETTAGTVLWEGDFSAQGQRKLELDLDNQPDEIALLSFYITPRTEGEDWLYLAQPEIRFPKPAEITKNQPAPLVMDKTKPRTIVLIFEDAMRRSMLPTYGNDIIATPNIDRYAASGMVFDNCYVPSNWTFPSFSSVFTSQPFTKTGAVRKIAIMVDNIPTLAGELSRNGWETAILTGNFITGPRAGLSRGYHDVLEVYNLIQHQPPITAEDFLPVLSDYLNRVDGQKDVFITMHLMDTHEPYTILNQYKEHYAQEYDHIAREMPWLGKCRNGFTADDIKDKVLAVYSSVAYFDSVLPRMVQIVGDKRYLGNTIFIVLSDHGEELCEHGDIGHGNTLYEELIHIPLIIWGDGVKPGRSDGFVNSIDLMPTILELAGVKVPAGLEGQSFAGLLRGEDSIQHRVIFSAMQKGMTSLKCAIQSPWKIIYTEGIPELYNLAVDPQESRNLAGDHPIVFGYMRGVLWQWWRKIHTGGIAENNQQLVLSPQEIELLRGLGYVQK